MREFLNRIDVQRKVINEINSKRFHFPLVGLSKQSIDRWQTENSIKNDTRLLNLLLDISAKLFFLSNKSQEQITEDYKNKSLEISELIEALKIELETNFSY
ncbi:hypothetical protein C7S20_09180 [Christiangramia fulva]|uniref:Uncharacterized protein n=1 Tax=Christiangramia fulva TaxID=2126553 RepID=A0A2R3Z5B1_9FLAO|nr:hypothetical protein [Christiangramia fulva]AVR45428.1 hypothetical protein C7S20_09180 [Christiangramia fulva]